MSKLKDRLKTYLYTALEYAKESQLQQLEECYSELCELHKSESSVEGHGEIRAMRDRLKAELARELEEKDYKQLEEEFALVELQAEAVAFVQTTDEFLSQDPLDEEIQNRLGVGLELHDAFKRLKLPLNGLDAKLKESNDRLFESLKAESGR